MIDILKNMLGFGPKADLKVLAENGAQIIDVRTKSEFQSGHLKGSVNIPVDSLGNNLGKLKKNKPIITCCASGMRSGSAVRILKSHGFSDVHNGGAWTDLQYKISGS